MDCVELFEKMPTGPESAKRAAFLQENHPDCHCEQSSVSKFSPGIVANDELAFRLIFSPIHIQEDGTLNPAAFSDVETQGLSCNRNPTEVAGPELHERGTAQAESFNQKEKNSHKPKRSYLGAVFARCAEIRALAYESGSRAFGVFDTANEENTQHIEIFQTIIETPGHRKLLRKRLRDKFSKRPEL